MQSELMTSKEEKHLLPNKNDRGQRRVYSDVLTGNEEIIKDLKLSIKTNEIEGSVSPFSSKERCSEVESVKCECCGMSEDCTPTYISRVQEFFCGKWLCGICSEAVKEKMTRDPKLALNEALESHMTLCKQFNRITRLNPKLSLTGAMRDIARKSFQHRNSKDLPKIDRMEIKIRRSSFQ